MSQWRRYARYLDELWGQNCNQRKTYDDIKDWYELLCSMCIPRMNAAIFCSFFYEGKHMEIECMNGKVSKQSNFKEIRKCRLTWFKWNYLGIKLEKFQVMQSNNGGQLFMLVLEVKFHSWLKKAFQSQ